MNHEKFMKPLKPIQQLLQEVLCLLFWQRLLRLGFYRFHIRIQITLIAILHHQIMLLLRLNMVQKTNHVLISNHLHNPLLRLKQLLPLLNTLQFLLQSLLNRHLLPLHWYDKYRNQILRHVHLAELALPHDPHYSIFPFQYILIFRHNNIKSTP